MPRPETMTMFKGMEDKIAALQANFEGKLEAIRIANEKVFDATMKELASLRESRSEGTGRGAAVIDQRANIATIISLALIVLAILGYVATR